MNKLFSVLFCLMYVIVSINGEESNMTTTESDTDCPLKINPVTGAVTFNDLNECFMVNSSCLWIDISSEMCGTCSSSSDILLLVGQQNCSAAADGTTIDLDGLSGTIRCEQSTATITEPCDLFALADNSTITIPDTTTAPSDDKANIKYNIYYTLFIFNIIIVVFQILL